MVRRPEDERAASPAPGARLAPITRRLLYGVAIGFAAIAVSLAAAWLLLHRRHRAVEANVETIVSEESVASFAAYEMEGAISGVGLAVSGYINEGQRQSSRAEVKGEAARFDDAYRRYRRVAHTDDERALGKQMRDLQTRHLGLGESLMSMRDRREELRKRIAADVGELDREMAALPARGPSASRVVALRGGVRELARALGQYLAAPDPTYQASALAGLDALARSYDEISLRAGLAISQVGVTIELLRVDVRELVDLDVRLRQGSGELGSLRAQLDALHRNIQVVAQREAAAASRQATLGIQPAASLALIGAVLLVVAIAGVVILRWSFRLRSAAVELDQETRRRRAAEVDRAQLLERLVTAHEEERSRISRELHDEMGQKLSALIFGLDRIVGDSPRDDRGARDLGALRDVAGGLLDDVHAVAFQLRPPALTDLGLHGALSGLVDAWRTQCEVAIDLFCEIDTRLSPVVETTLFRVVQEALTNIRKHAGASSVSVLVRRNGEGIRLVVDDDGRGFSPDEGQSPEKLGLRGMRERVQTVGGSLEFESIPGKGTSVVVSIPVVS